MDNQPRVLHPGDPEAQALARAIASPTAGEILQALEGEPLTASALARKTGMPITTAAYHLERLVEAGVIEVTGTRWSRKGREQKVYRLVDRVVIVAPGREDLGALLRKYAALGLALGAASLLAGFFDTWLGAPTAFSDRSGEAGSLPAPAAGPALDVPGPVARWVLLGGLVVLLALIAYDAARAWRRRSRSAR